MASGGGEDQESSSSGEGSEELNNVERKGNISEYEKQRLSRIAENKARMEALGLSKAASGLMGLSPGGRKHRGKANSCEEDDDYRPGEADDDDDDDEDGEYEEDDDKDEESLGHIRSGSGKRKAKNKGVGSKKKVSSKMNLDNTRGYTEEDDDEDNLRKAIALSLKDTLGGGSSIAPSKKNISGKESGNGKKKKPFVSRLQMTEDELIIYFYQFDEDGKGFVTVRDLVKMAMMHDFTWTKEELQDMIQCYDGDNDGKLSLDDFKKIVKRCRMLKESDG